MELYLLRHGQTGSGKNYIRSRVTSGMNDKALTAAGIAEVEQSGEALRILNIKPDAIITSPPKRAYQTAEIIGSILFGKERSKITKRKMMNQLNKFQIWNDLAPEGDRTNVYKNLARFKYDSKVLIIGHEPFLTKMIAEIVSSSPDTTGRRSHSSSDPYLRHSQNDHHSIVLKKAGLAKVSIISMNPKLIGELRWLLTPMLLRKISLIKARKKEKKKKNQIRYPYEQIASTPVVTPTVKSKSTRTTINH